MNNKSYLLLTNTADVVLLYGSTPTLTVVRVCQQFKIQIILCEILMPKLTSVNASNSVVFLIEYEGFALKDSQLKPNSSTTNFCG